MHRRDAFDSFVSQYSRAWISNDSPILLLDMGTALLIRLQDTASLCCGFANAHWINSRTFIEPDRKQTRFKPFTAGFGCF